MASPPLLRSLAVNLRGGRFLPRLRALAAWLAVVAAPHLHHLDLDLSGHKLETGRPELEALDAQVTVPAMLAACGAGGQLTQLRLNLSTLVVPISSWVAPLGARLQTLYLRGRPLQVIGPLQALSNLQELELHLAVLQPAALLPASLTKLVLVPWGTQLEMPPQVRAVPAGPAGMRGIENADERHAACVLGTLPLQWTHPAQHWGCPPCVPSHAMGNLMMFLLPAAVVRAHSAAPPRLRACPVYPRQL